MKNEQKPNIASLKDEKANLEQVIKVAKDRLTAVNKQLSELVPAPAAPEEKATAKKSTAKKTTKK